jgi:hypothetical protein
MATIKSAAVLAAALAASLALADQTEASTDRRFSYSAENEQAKHRTQDIHLLVRQGLLGGMRVLHLYRSRGDGFDLKPVYSPWSEAKLKVALQGDPRGVSLYAIDPVEGEGFARGACRGPRAWLAMVPPQPLQPLVIAVLGDDPANHAPVVCETLEYRWQGEWQLPTRRNDSGRQERGAQKTF